jgi:hypothetical protein
MKSFESSTCVCSIVALFECFEHDKQVEPSSLVHFKETPGISSNSLRLRV